ncbi:FAD-binding domain-containing protein [Phycomyces nitens]|nr:FAD-binding domain-containing protein [Phycomyces nitens]
MTYSGALAGVLAGFTFLLTIRHGLMTWNHSHSKPSPLSSFIKRYSRIEQYIINKCSYTAIPRIPIFPPIGTFLILIALLSTGIPLLLVNTDLALNSNRAGFLALSIVPFVLGSTGKSSAMSFLTGISPTKLNVLHRMLGTSIAVLATIHMAFHIKSWAKFPVFLASQLSLLKVHYGLAGYACLMLVFVGSIYPVRKYSHEFFIFTHLFAFGFIGAIAKHTPYAMRYFVAGIIVYVLNVFASWCVKSHVAHARVEIMPERCVRLSLRLSSPMVHTPGQYVSLCIPSVSWFEWHPFTITSAHVAEDGACDKIEVYITVRGNWTRKLFEKIDPSQELNVLLSGPFGNGSSDLQANTMLTEHDTIAILNGGAGITFGIRLFRELYKALIEEPDHCLQSRIKTKNIHFLWSVRSMAELGWFREEIQQIMDSFEYAHQQNPERFPSLHVAFFVTRQKDDCSNMTIDAFSETVENNEKVTRYTMETSGLMKQKESDDMNTSSKRVQPSIVSDKRVDLKSFFKANRGDSMGVFACGPPGFNGNIKNIIAGITDCKTIPYLHCEDFEI